MPLPESTRSPGVQWISDSAMAKIIDRRAKNVLNISGKTFVRNRKRGKYASLDADECPGIIELALIAPKAKGKTTRARKKS